MGAVVGFLVGAREGWRDGAKEGKRVGAREVVGEFETVGETEGELVEGTDLVGLLVGRDVVVGDVDSAVKPPEAAGPGLKVSKSLQ